MEFRVRISKAKNTPKVYLVIGEAVTSFRDKYTGLDPGMDRWIHTPLLKLGDAVTLSGRIIGLPPTTRDYKLGMLAPAFSFWARSIDVADSFPPPRPRPSHGQR